MSFGKLLHGIQSGNDGDLDTARSLYIKILCIRAKPLSFLVCQGMAPDPRECGWVTGSRDCCTEDTVCAVAM